VASPIAWRLATITAVRPETPTVRSFTLSLPDWAGHRAGQHVDLRLTAEDGYSVERSYSIASEPERAGEIELTVERIEDGEVSGFLHDVAAVGDRIEVRGPIGGYFVWDATGPLAEEPLFLVAASVVLLLLVLYVLFVGYVPSKQRVAGLEAELKDLYKREAELQTRIAQQDQRYSLRERQFNSERDALMRRLEEVEKLLAAARKQAH